MRLLLEQLHFYFNTVGCCPALDFTRFYRHISTSSSKLLECQRAQLFQVTVHVDQLKDCAWLSRQERNQFKNQGLLTAISNSLIEGIKDSVGNFFSRHQRLQPWRCSRRGLFERSPWRTGGLMNRPLPSTA